MRRRLQRRPRPGLDKLPLTRRIVRSVKTNDRDVRLLNELLMKRRPARMRRSGKGIKRNGSANWSVRKRRGIRKRERRRREKIRNVKQKRNALDLLRSVKRKQRKNV
jgi:hypothetical protein